LSAVSPLFSVSIVLDLEGKLETNTNAFNDVTARCSAGVLTGDIGGDGDIAATSIVPRPNAFVLDTRRSKIGNRKSTISSPR